MAPWSRNRRGRGGEDRGVVATYRYTPLVFKGGWPNTGAGSRQFLTDNHVRWSRITTTHTGGGMTKGRAAYSIMKLGAKTDIEAGTITQEDAGNLAEERQSPFNPQTCGAPGAPADAWGAPGCVGGGYVIS